MGCTSSIPGRYKNGRRRKKKGSRIAEVAVFVPCLRVPVAVDLQQGLRGIVGREVVERIMQRRSRIVLLAQENVLEALEGILEVQRALEDYLPVLIGLIEKERRLEALVEFKWRSLGDNGQEICLASAWYELLSVIHMMAILSLLEANQLLIPKDCVDARERKVSEDAKKVAVDLLLKASGFLEYCIHHILVHLPIHIRRNLPKDLQEGVLEAVSIQALGQGVEMQLGLAMECDKATLPVKRRLACEEVIYFAQAHYCLSGCENSDANGKKLLLFLKYKYLEAKSAAYYYHGLVLGKGSEPNDQVSSVWCHFAANDLLIESKRACLSFCLAKPLTRVPAAWGVMKHLQKKIPETASKKSQMYGDLIEQDKAYQTLPDLPEFTLSLKPDDYELPEIAEFWVGDKSQPQIQMLKEHLKDDDDDDTFEPIEDLNL
ncbi:uncharacterized protein LOC120275383 [Dioscorea cayenensis subsp. rotundata]|uniref:Uncharacterized protein LOC120275383 n=1 Tax=Dioscorea cayennensis subsp. rotundata TaxID=55577 RepID=A0AB40CGI5_DIOCR|nr:uncharacterized protein LOC120275383 [Dioscorea cayenensis subsp. rotundata]